MGLGQPGAALGQSGSEGVLIIFGTVALFLVVLYAVSRRERWGVPVEERPGLVRAISAVLAAAIAAGAALWLNHLASEPDVIALGYLVTTAICLGAVIYLIGTVIGYGLFGLRLRWAGWIVMTLGFVVPSTFSLALPIVLFLGVTLRPLPPRPEGEQPSRDVVVPR